jgi:hypothetical protein
LIFEIFDLMLSDWVSFAAYLNLFEIKDFIVININMCKIKFLRDFTLRAVRSDISAARICSEYLLALRFFLSQRTVRI